ncbi:porin [Algoriphagus sp.]|uniref:porin n=1 Tax=Algoriphagus sp. TaxID=1872435 RepID=UPI003273F080
MANRFSKRWMLLAMAIVCVNLSGFSQEAAPRKSPFSVSSFLDVYYGYDFTEPKGGERFPFMYNHNRNTKLAVNLALVKVGYDAGRFQANLGLQQGTYAEDNYSAEPKALRWIHEANVGYALDSDRSIWLKAGVLPSHIGFESAVSSDNLTLSRSLIAENSPYFETGVQLSWQRDERWYFAFLYLNGWQRIQSIPGKNRPSFGTQATFSPSEKLILNWSTFLGTDQGLEAGTMLYFSNVYGNFQLDGGWNLIAGFDVGTRTLETEPSRDWWGTSVILQKEFSGKFASAIRYEYYHDPFQAIAASNVTEGIQTNGLSLNADYRLGDSFLFRLEGRWLKAPSGFNLGVNTENSSNFFLLGSVGWNWNSRP